MSPLNGHGEGALVRVLSAPRAEPAAGALLHVLPILAADGHLAFGADWAPTEVLREMVREFRRRIGRALRAGDSLTADVDGEGVEGARGGGYAEASGWYRENLTAVPLVVDLAAALGLDAECWQIAVAAEPGFAAAFALEPWQRTAAAGLAAADRLEDRHARGSALLSLGAAHRFAGRPGQALHCYTEALEAFTDTADVRAQCLARLRLAEAYLDTRQLEEALAASMHVIMTAEHDPMLHAVAAFSAAGVHAESGYCTEAMNLARRGLALLREAGAGPRWFLEGHLQLALACTGAGALDAAENHVHEVLSAVERQDGLPALAVAAHLADGELNLVRGRFGDALCAFERANRLGLSGFRRADILEGVGRALTGQGKPVPAVVLQHSALLERRGAGVGFHLARALYYLAGSYTAAGMPGQAAQASAEALDHLASVDRVADPVAQALYEAVNDAPL